MAQENKHRPLTTTLYVTGDTPSERRDNIRETLAHAANNCDENWVTKPSFEKNVAAASEFVEDTEPGKQVKLTESDFKPPLGNLRILNDKGASDGGLSTLLKGSSTTSYRQDIIVTTPNVLCTRGTGLSHIATLLDEGHDVHFASHGITLTAGTTLEGLTKRALISITDAVHPEHEGDTDATWSWIGGRPPIGFEVADSGDRLVETDRHPYICRVLQKVVNGQKSTRRASKDLDVARATVDNAIENRPEMYDLVK